MIGMEKHDCSWILLQLASAGTSAGRLISNISYPSVLPKGGLILDFNV